MNKQMKIGIIIVSYNKKDLLENCLKSLEKVSYANFETLVVDNGSSDGSWEMASEKFPQVSWLPMGHNSGFCKANNVGIKKAWELGCEAILLLNNDTEVEPDFLTAMVGELNQTEKIGMVAAQIPFLKRKNVLDSCGLVITPDGLAKNRGSEQAVELFGERAEVFCPAGAAALYTKELLEDVQEDGQYLDETFGFYFEELDLGWRAKLRGWKCSYAPKAVVYHLKSATAGAYSEFVAFHTNRNIFFIMLKNYQGIFFLRALTLTFLRYVFLLAGIFQAKGPAGKIHKQIGPFKMLRACGKGWLDVFRQLPAMLKKRRLIKKNTVVSKAETASWFLKFGISFLDSIYQ